VEEKNMANTDVKNKTADEIIEIEDDEAMIVTLEFEDGGVLETEAMGVFEVDGKEYIALIPDNGTDDVYIYGYKEVGEDEFELVDIEDDEEFKCAVAEFDKIVALQE
jgi:transcriptional antiterminator Rof (Rho-off)